jgi:hypothetical protein
MNFGSMIATIQRLSFLEYTQVHPRIEFSWHTQRKE